MLLVHRMVVRIMCVVIAISLTAGLVAVNASRPTVSAPATVDPPGAGSYALVAPPSMDDAILAAAR
jgi:hypothetical protein